MFHLHTYPLMKMEQIECSETLGYKIQTPVNYPKGSIHHSGYGESLKSRLYFNVIKWTAPTSRYLVSVYILVVV